MSKDTTDPEFIILMVILLSILFLGFVIATVILEGDAACVTDEALNEVCRNLSRNPESVFLDTDMRQSSFICHVPQKAEPDIKIPVVYVRNWEITP